MSTTNKNYPLIKETDSNGNPLNAYDQLVTESNNFRRAVDNDINEVDNKVSSLEQNISFAHPSNRLTFTPNSSVVSGHGVVVANNGELLTITGWLNLRSDQVIAEEIGSINIKLVRPLPFVVYNSTQYLHKAMMINAEGKIYFRNDDTQVKANNTLNFAAIIPIF